MTSVGIRASIETETSTCMRTRSSWLDAVSDDSFEELK